MAEPAVWLNAVYKFRIQQWQEFFGLDRWRRNGIGEPVKEEIQRARQHDDDDEIGVVSLPRRCHVIASLELGR